VRANLDRACAFFSLSPWERVGVRASHFHQPFRHDEQRDALDAGNQLAVRPRDLGEHQVHDVLGQFVFAGRDPHLVARQPVARAERVGFEAVAVRHGARRDIGQRRAGLRLRERHRAGPAARQLVEREHLLLQYGAVFEQQVGVADREHARADADRGHGEEAVGRRLHRVRQLHAAELVVLRGAQHARGGIGFMRLVGRLGQDHLLAVEARLLDVHRPVERRVLLARDAFAGVEYRVEGFARMVGKARPAGQLLDLQPVVQEEFEGGTVWHVIQWASQRRSRKSFAEAAERSGRRPKLLLDFFCGFRASFAASAFGCSAVLRSFYKTSNTPAAPMPPPMHIVTSTRLAPRRLPSISAWPVRR